MPELDCEPLNREPPGAELVSSFLTTKNGYDRNHGGIPHIDISQHRIRVDGAVDNILDLSMNDLNEFPHHTVVCALQCAGARRHTMSTRIKAAQGIDWSLGAVMNCKWRGPKLRDILEKAKVKLAKEEKGHVAFASYATACQEDEWFGASIDLERAMDEDKDVILAVEMNDSPLTAEHGFPCRVICPGIVGVRSVKWVQRITVQTVESSNFYQQHDYKVLPPQAVDSESASDFWASTPALQSMPVNSAIALPESGTKVQKTAEGEVTCQGWAVPSGEGGPVVKVEISGDQGKTWTEAEILHDAEEGKWSWTLWKGAVKVDAGRCIFSRATDKSGQTQPETSQWNLRGVGYNGYGESTDLEIV